MDNIKPIGIVPNAKPGEPDAAIIALLENVLAEAKAGKIESVAVATVEFGEEIGTMFNVGTSWLKLLGSVAALQHELVAYDPDNE